MAYAWGLNGTDTCLGVGDTLSPHTTPTLIAGGRDYLAAVANGIAIGADGNLYSFGFNQWGTSWDGTQSSTFITVPQLVTVVPGPYKKVGSLTRSTLVLTASGDLWACGTESEGEFGLGDSAILVPYPSGVLIQTGVADFGPGRNHLLVLLNTGHVLAAGANTSGFLGVGDTVDRSTWTDVTPGTGTVVGVAAGAEESFLLMADGTVLAAGVYSFGQLGPNLGDPRSNLIVFTTTFADAGFANVVELTCGHAADTSGAHLNAGSTDSQTYVRLADGTVWACGLNEPYGSFGAGNATVPDSSASLVQVALPAGVTATSLMQGSQGLGMGCIGSDGLVYMWGRGSEGQMGNGTTTTANPTPVVASGISGMQWLMGWEWTVFAGIHAPVAPPPRARSYAQVIG